MKVILVLDLAAEAGVGKACANLTKIEILKKVEIYKKKWKFDKNLKSWKFDKKVETLTKSWKFGKSWKFNEK